ncbi:MAG: DUF1385 domain-containing protein [Acidobacteria bacterium]|nr:DUF1385 domain-containing protein [Acidobacteriota bacterium]
MSMKVGGQAVPEGVMMRSGDRFAVAVRQPGGAIAVTTGPMPTWGRPLRRVPVVRGVVALAEALPVGIRAMRWSATSRRASLVPTAALVTAALVVPPMLVARLGAVGRNAVISQLLELVLAAAVVAGALAATGRLDRIRRLFEYHGAEHKVVAAYEAGVDLTPAAAAGFSTRHPRCGTSLLLWLVVLTALASVVPGLAARPLALPLIIGVAAELQMRAAGATSRAWGRNMVRPGLALQRLTTRQPSLGQLEVAIAALAAAVAPVEDGQPAADLPLLAVPA